MGATLPASWLGREDKECAQRNETEAHDLAEAERLLEVEYREDGEHGERQNLLDRLQLGGRIDGVAVAIGRHGEAVLEERDQPGNNNDEEQRLFLEAQVAVPR